MKRLVNKKMSNKSTIEKKARIIDLLFSVDCYEVDQFFDLESEKLLDEKIEVLTALKDGKQIKDIPNFYKYWSLCPKTGKSGIDFATIKQDIKHFALAGCFFHAKKHRKAVQYA